MNAYKNREWSIAVFAYRENVDVLSSCIDSVIIASKNKITNIDVLINGNTNLARDTATVFGNKIIPKNITLNIWNLLIPDKAETWNQYLHRFILCLLGVLCFFMENCKRNGFPLNQSH